MADIDYEYCKGLVADIPTAALEWYAPIDDDDEQHEEQRH